MCSLFLVALRCLDFYVIEEQSLLIAVEWNRKTYVRKCYKSSCGCQVTLGQFEDGESVFRLYANPISITKGEFIEKWNSCVVLNENQFFNSKTVTNVSNEG
jgi:hypothetical protein